LVANLALLMGNARSVIKRLRFPLDIMLLCVRWYVAYPLSLRNLEEMMQERGVFVDHSTIHRRLIKLVPVLGGSLS
jgi:putative transposase